MMDDMDKPLPTWPAIARDPRGAWATSIGDKRFAVRETHGPMSEDEARAALAPWVKA